MAETFETLRPLLFSIAYRMLGSAAEAEDMVQETYLRYQAVPPESVRGLKPFLTTVVTRLCLDQLKSARVGRESYLGEWLPEPLLTDDYHDPAARLRDYDTISMAFLVLLENLSPLERAVFLLREVFDYEYADIAQIVEREESACRQLFRRAKQHITENRPRYSATPEVRGQMIARFLRACAEGDLEGFVSLLADDVAAYSDSGGKVRGASMRVVRGQVAVARLILGLLRRMPADGSTRIAEVNGTPAIISRGAGAVFSVILLESDADHIHAIRIIANPDKLITI